MEERPLAKENTQQSNQCRTQSRESGPNGLGRVREVAKKDGKVRFTALLHHVTVDLLRDSYHSLKKKAAPGVDGVTWREYGESLEARLSDLHGRIHRGAYPAQPSRRVWILRKKVNWVLDLDVRSFFDKVEHSWLVKFVEHRIADQRIIRLIQKWLKAGVMEDGRWFETKEGTPQGSVISPSLANLYLHHVLDLWVEAWRKKIARGDVIAVRYADDAVLGFQHGEDAERFLEQLRERMGKFGLELHPEKTRLIEFGRYATERRAKRGEGKPETYNFLGFPHICGTSHKTGYFTVQRKTIGKRMAAKLKDLQAKLRQRMHEKIRGTLEWLQSVVRGYFRYHAIPGNEERLRAFLHEVRRGWLRMLRRRSQRSRWTWTRFQERLVVLLPAVDIQHPYPTERFDAKHPRQEPCA